MVLKDGSVVQGTYKGGDATEIRFEVDGVAKSYPLHTITTITLSPRSEPAPPAPAPATVPAATSASGTAPSSGPVTVPAGTMLMVKFAKPVSTASHPEGSTFQVVLEQDLVVDGVKVAAKGASVYGKVVSARGGKRLGAQYLKVSLTGLSINNRNVPIETDVFGVEGGRGKTARTVGAGALIGAAADGSDGAAKGAAVGGALALLGPGSHVQFPVGTIMEVPLMNAVTVSP
jgi:hypothetical protein